MIPKLVDGRTSCSSSATTRTSTTPSRARIRARAPFRPTRSTCRAISRICCRLPNPAQYQIYDPLTVRPDPANPSRFIRDPFPNNIIPARPDRRTRSTTCTAQMVPPPNQNFVENGRAERQLLPGRRARQPMSQLYGGRRRLQLSRQRSLLLPRQRQHVPRGGERLDLRDAGVRGPALGRPIAL